MNWYCTGWSHRFQIAPETSWAARYMNSLMDWKEKWWKCNRTCFGRTNHNLSGLYPPKEATWSHLDATQRHVFPIQLKPKIIIFLFGRLYQRTRPVVCERSDDICRNQVRRLLGLFNISGQCQGPWPLSTGTLLSRPDSLPLPFLWPALPSPGAANGRRETSRSNYNCICITV